MALGAFTFGFLCLDAWLKTVHLRNLKEQGDFKKINQLENKELSVMDFGMRPVYEGDFSVTTHINWTQLIYLMIIWVLLIFLCVGL